METPRELGLPYSDWRPGQRLAIRTLLTSKKSHVVLNAPTGSGKSTIAWALPRLDPTRRHVTLTATKALQDQYNVMPAMTDLRGASNYECRASHKEMHEYFTRRKPHTVRCDEGPCHIGVSCPLKVEGCDYFDAKRQFVVAHAGITNYSAWLAHRRMGQGLGMADVLVCDEAHALPEQLMAAYGVDVPHSLVQGITTPKGYKGWQRWAEDQLGAIATLADDNTTVKRETLERGLRLLSQMDKTWAWDINTYGYHFEPTVPRLLLPMLQTFDGSSKVIYMSATITPSMLDMLDVPDADIEYHTMPSHFPVERRPVYVLPGVRNDYRSMKNDDNFFRMVDVIDDVIEPRDDRRGLVHSVSFDRAADIYQHSRHQHRMTLHRRGQPIAKVVAEFLAGNDTDVLVSPSIMTGFNFPYRAAEFQIIPKLPFPNSASAIMRRRIKATPRYRDHYVMTHLIQACGRINRAADDQGETFITDGHFAWWYDQNRDLAADWFDEAIIRTRRAVRPIPRLAA